MIRFAVTKCAQKLASSQLSLTHTWK